MIAHPTQPMIVIRAVHRHSDAMDLLEMQCGHVQLRPHRHLWGRRTSCDKCPAKAVAHGQ